MRRTVALVAGLLLLAAVNWGIMRRESQLAGGIAVLLELAPVDPRSLMQGDYMALRFKVANEIPGRHLNQQTADGRIIVRLDERGVGRFLRRDDGSALNPGEIAMRYRVRHGTVKFATNAYFFQEGTAGAFEAARYCEFRAAPSGDLLLANLRGANLERLGPPVR